MHSKYFQLTHFHYVLWANSFSNRCWNHRNKWISSINVSIEKIFVEKFCHEIRAIFADWVTSQQMFWPKLKLFARKLGAFFRDGNSIQCRFSISHNLQVLVEFFFFSKDNIRITAAKSTAKLASKPNNAKQQFRKRNELIENSSVLDLPPSRYISLSYSCLWDCVHLLQTAS